MAAVNEPPPNDMHAEEEAGPSATIQPPMCQICLLAPSKYKCPGCDMRTCSLSCVKAHKEPKGGSSGCNGKRDRLKFVSLENFDDRQLLSDYQLLEEVKRVDDVARRCLPPFPRAQLPPALQSLVYQANKRRVDLRLMAPGMSRRVNNTTRFNGQDQKLSWRVEWHFYPTPVANPGLPLTLSSPHAAGEVQEAKRVKVEDEGGVKNGSSLLVTPVNEEEVDLGEGDEEEEEEGGEEGAEGQEVVEGHHEAHEEVLAKASEGEALPSQPSLHLSRLPPPIVLVDEKVGEDQTLLQILQNHLSQYRPNTGAGARQFLLRDFGRDASLLKVCYCSYLSEPPWFHIN